MTSKIIIAGLVALAFVAGTMMTETIAYAEHKTDHESNAGGLGATQTQVDQNTAAVDSFFDVFTELEGSTQRADSFFDVFFDIEAYSVDSFFDIFTELQTDVNRIDGHVTVLKNQADSFFGTSCDVGDVVIGTNSDGTLICAESKSNSVSLGTGTAHVFTSVCRDGSSDRVQVSGPIILLSDGTVKIPNADGMFQLSDPLFGNLPLGIWSDATGTFTSSYSPENCNPIGDQSERTTVSMNACAVNDDGDLYCVDAQFLNGQLTSGNPWSFKDNVLP